MNRSTEYLIAIMALDDDDGGGYLGFVPDLPGCISDGDTRDEALRNTELALNEWLELQSSREKEIPEPGAAAESARAKEEKLLDAIALLADYRESADEKIASLERQLTELIAVLKDDVGRLPSRYTPSSKPAISKKVAH
ncbi:MAG: type II toxin-antitoxin system HicB family antitoxin [Litoreibacter sp.]|nr:type II toxin-antitoxin system HicB family antitoxin [Litoreibacter sp.]